ncbi:MAG: cytochrome c oxidase assembly protein [Rhizobiales bacterium]|nr:cytochrome c oxidase assembly protein [Hyphomicrobiales bacterium]MBA69157.1 cytochrome c oxidase assembly protein [Hyphomicrobiales bacterium]
MTATRSLLWAFIFVLALLLGWLSFEWYRSAGGPGEAPYGVPFQLTDQNGDPITEQALRGQPTALFFGFTHCPEVCPTTLFELDGWLKQADPDGDSIDAYFVTVDPERDTPEVLKNYVSAVSDRITGISGSPEKIAEVVKGFHIYAKKVPLESGEPDDYTMDHTASVFLLDSDGRFKSTIAWGEDPEIAVKKLENLVKG